MDGTGRRGGRRQFEDAKRLLFQLFSAGTCQERAARMAQSRRRPGRRRQMSGGGPPPVRCQSIADGAITTRRPFKAQAEPQRRRPIAGTRAFRDDDCGSSFQTKLNPPAAGGDGQCALATATAGRIWLSHSLIVIEHAGTVPTAAAAVASMTTERASNVKKFEM
jgi:hypothetical protein